MPIVTVELVGDEPHAAEPSLAQPIADAVARVIGSSPGQTWVRVRWLPRGNYAENNVVVSGRDLPVFVGILMHSPPVGEALASQVSALTRAIADAVGRPANLVHVEYAPAASDRVSFGGKLVR
jgi:phenylpyruvate tautomerase PptA (4-oxalocrotonate tautomerase family)